MIIPSIPLSHLLFTGEKDTDILMAYNWFKTFIHEEDWLKRKDAIELHLRSFERLTEPFSEPITDGTLFAIKKDVIGWYLYLAYTYLFEPHKYEYFQGARVIPIFKRIGMDINLCLKISGIEKKMRLLFKKRTDEADSILFEVLTALIWVRNGWDVAFIEEGKGGKSPDLQAVKGSEKWQIECKRQSKSADYTYRETKKRQVMISKISRLLLEYNIMLNITFHVELFSLSDNYLFDLLNELIPKIRTSGKIISNNQADIEVSFVDIKSIQNHLQKYYVKNNSPQLLELLGGKEVDYSAFTSGFIGSYYYLGEDKSSNVYVSNIVKAFGVHCICDSEIAINAKARDVRALIFKAISQFNPESKSIIHIGMETFDGPKVEKARTAKIIKTVEDIDPNSNNVHWIFLHYLQSYTRSYMDWYFDETVSPLTSLLYPILPIKQTFLVIPEDEISIDDGSHWDKELP